MHEPSNLKISTRVMYDEFNRQGIPVRVIDSASSMLEYVDRAGESHLVFSTSSDKSSAAGHIISDNKLRTECIAKELNIPVPEDILCTDFSDAKAFLKQYKNVVLKPLNCSGGAGVSTNVTTEQTLRVAYDYATEYGDCVIAQQYIAGSDIRLLIIAGRFRSAIERRPAQVIGDGSSSIQDLITAANRSNNRSDSYQTNMCLINVESSHRHLQDAIGLIPDKGQVVSVVGPANISLGGSAHEATSLVTDMMIFDAEKITQKLGLAIAGVDMIWDEETDKYALIEVNATPGIDMHNDQLWGTSSDAVERYVKWLADPNSRIARHTTIQNHNLQKQLVTD